MKVKKIFKAGLILALACGTLFSNPSQLKSYTGNVAYATEEGSKETEKEETDKTEETEESKESKERRAQLEGFLAEIKKIQDGEDYKLATEEEKIALNEVKADIEEALKEKEITAMMVAELSDPYEIAKASLSTTPEDERYIDFTKPRAVLIQNYKNTIERLEEAIEKDEEFEKSVIYNDVDENYQENYKAAINRMKKAVENSKDYLINNVTNPIKLDDINKGQKEADKAEKAYENAVEDIKANAKKTKNIYKIINDQEELEKSEFYKKASDKDKKAYQDIIKEAKTMYDLLIKDKDAYSQDEVNDLVKRYNAIVKEMKKDDDALEAKYKELEDAVYKNEVQAEAARILLKKNPKSTASIKEELEDLIKESEALVKRAKDILKAAGRL